MHIYILPTFPIRVRVDYSFPHTTILSKSFRVINTVPAVNRTHQLTGPKLGNPESETVIYKYSGILENNKHLYVKN